MSATHFIVEVRRYDEPVTDRFMEYDLNAGPGQVELSRAQLREDMAEVKRQNLAEQGWVRHRYTPEITVEQFQLVRMACPIEFHRQLHDLDPIVTDRIHLWFRPTTEAVPA